MKLISETNVSRTNVVLSPAYWRPVLQVNFGVERRYRQSPCDFFGLFDVRETEWEDNWVVAQILDQ
jgi:hypothetical protein